MAQLWLTGRLSKLSNIMPVVNLLLALLSQEVRLFSLLEERGIPLVGTNE